MPSYHDPTYIEEIRARERDRQRARRQSALEAETSQERSRRLESQNQRIESAEQRNDRLALHRAAQARYRAALEAQCYHVSLKLAAFNYNPSHNLGSHFKLNIGKIDQVCRFCHARKFKGESQVMCCANGKIKFPLTRPPPEPLWSLFSYDTSMSKEFMRFIRRYNSCFSMTSFGSSGGHEWTGFHPTFRVQGQIYHMIGSLLPNNPDEAHKFLQVYFLGDSELQIDTRTGLFRDVKRNLVANFQELLENNNHLIRMFRTALERLPSDSDRIVIRADKRPTGAHARTYNAPTSDEVAIVMNDSELSRRDIVIQRRDANPLNFKHIDESHPFYDALQYPLIFWQGQGSWHFNMRRIDPTTGQETPKRATPMDFYSYQFQIRGDDSNFLLHCGPLLNQYAVDMYAKIEAQRLLFYRQNQAKLRADEYIHLRDALRNDGNVNNIGTRVILPSSYIGSPRHMHEYTQDALSYVRKFGRPDLFITFTCNPNWPEITRELEPNQPPSDRQDISARVFRQKIIKLMELITKHDVFGASNCHMYSIEWQKRGLPHSHILVWLRERIRPEQIDMIISAELPSPVSDPVLFKIIQGQMIHGPCSRDNPSSVCINDRGKCEKHYPHPFLNETQTGEDGYPKYRRRSPSDGGFSFTTTYSGRGEVVIDNRWVVPHNPTLCRMFNAHINVEYCHSVKSIKYICKYINKGSDLASVQLERRDDLDEINHYQTHRYLNTNEAFWRIFSFPIHDRHPAVVQLAVHLENGQRVYFNEDNAREVVDNPPETTLTAFFKLCQTDQFARTLFYSEVCTYYTWSNKKWSARIRGANVPGQTIKSSDTIGRLYTVHPSQMECFFLRTLLARIRGPTSFQDLKTFDGQTYSTFRAVCQARGLLEDDNQWDEALSEASEARMPEHLRSLLAVILTSCYPSDPSRLWERYKYHLSEDILLTARRSNPTSDIEMNPYIYNQALILIENLTMGMAGHNLIELGLPAPNRSHLDGINLEVMRESSYDIATLRQILDNGLANMVPDQRSAYDGIISAIIGGNGGLFFIDAPGGTGKTFLLNLILARVRLESSIILACASSGIAATLLSGGRTAHTGLKLPLRGELMCHVGRGSAKAEVFRQCKAIIWDECTMAHKKSLEALDRTLRDIRRNEQLFGGVVIILAGDFRQTLPVIPRSTPADELNACLKQSNLWRHFKKYHLKTNMRVHLHANSEAGSFASKLLSIGDGLYPQNAAGRIKLTVDICQRASTTQELIEKVFPDISRNIFNSDWLCERAILAPRNDMVDKINSMIQDKLENHESRTYLSVDQTASMEDACHFPIEFINSLCPSGMPQHELALKVSSPVMVLRNLDPPRLCNGTRLSVTNLHRNIVEGKILAGPYKGETVFIPRIPFIIDNDVSPVKFKRIQFPLRLAFGITINKSQGQTLKFAGVDLSTPCFSHGQLYVACSRVGSRSNIFIQAPGNETKNIVYPQALQ